jgi:CheY-like chemotaxis protein
MEVDSKRAFYKKVLVIDDTDMDLIVAQMAMKKYLFAEEIVIKKSALSGLDYLELFNENPEELPQLIFLDINMPELSGFDFLERYEKLPDTIKRNCIIMMLSTSLVDEDHKKAAENKFVSRFLNKPLDKNKLEGIKNEFHKLTDELKTEN